MNENFLRFQKILEVYIKNVMNLEIYLIRIRLNINMFNLKLNYGLK